MLNLQRFQTTVSPNRVILTPSNLKSVQFFFDATEETKLILDSSWKVLWDKSFNITIKQFFSIFLSHDKEKPFLNMIIKCSNFLSPPILKYQGKASKNRFYFCSNIKQKTGALSKRKNSLVSLALRCKLVSSRSKNCYLSLWITKHYNI